MALNIDEINAEMNRGTYPTSGTYYAQSGLTEHEWARWVQFAAYDEQRGVPEDEWAQAVHGAAAMQATRRAVLSHPDGGVAVWSKWSNDRARRLQAVTRPGRRSAPVRLERALRAWDARHPSTSP